MSQGSYIGLDIGASSIKAVTVGFAEDRTVELNNAYTLPMPEDAFADGNIINYGDVASQILKVIQDGNFPKLPIALAIKSSSTISKSVKVPYANYKTLQDDIRFVANQYMSVNFEEYSIDYTVVGVDKTIALADVLYAATKRELLNDYISVLESAMQKVEVIDLESLALCSLYNHMNMPQKGYSLILDIGHTDTELIFLKNGLFSFHDMSTASGQYCTDLLKNSSKVPMESIDLIKGSPEAFPAGKDVQNIIKETYLPDVVRDIDSGIAKYRLVGGDAPEYIALTGGGATTAGLIEKLKEVYGVPVEIMSLDRFVKVNNSSAAQILESKPAALNIAVSMALR